MQKIISPTLVPYEHYQQIDAELIGNEPAWYIAITAPNAERIAAAHLAGRRFGVYLPEFERVFAATRGRPARIEKRPLFPGYIFIFLWGIVDHIARIRACPGVVNLLYAGDQPAVVADELIDRIQFLEFKTWKPRRAKRQRWRKIQLQPGEEDIGDEVISISPYASITLESIKSLDDSARNSLLHRALGLNGVPVESATPGVAGWNSRNGGVVSVG